MTTSESAELFIAFLLFSCFMPFFQIFTRYKLHISDVKILNLSEYFRTMRKDLQVVNHGLLSFLKKDFCTYFIKCKEEQKEL